MLSSGDLINRYYALDEKAQSCSNADLLALIEELLELSNNSISALVALELALDAEC